MMINKGFMTKNKDNTLSSIKNIKDQPLESLSQILPVSIVCTSVIGFIVAIVMFIVEGGFSNQITAIKNDLFSGISEGFTSGTSSILTSGIVSTIISFFLLTEVIILIISYFKTESKAKKIAVGICLGIGGILFGFAGFFLAVGSGFVSRKAERMLIYMLSNFDENQIDTIVNVAKIITFIGAILLIVFIILMLISQHGWIVKNTIIAILISYIVLPLVLLFIENVIPMFIGLITIVIIVGILLFLGEVFLSGGGESSRSYDYEHSNYSEPPKVSKPSKINEPYQKEIKDWSGPFWRDEGGLGFILSQADHIYCYNIWKEKHAICTVTEFETGKVAIIDSKTNRRIMNIAGCKTPKR